MGQSRLIGDDQIRRKRTPFFRATSPLSRGTLESKGGGKLSIHFCADGDTIETVFRTIISVNQLSIYGAASEFCEEHSICQTSTGKPVLAKQSDPLFAPEDLLITTPIPSIAIPAQENWMQKHKERMEKLPQPDRLIKSLYWCRIPDNSWSRTILHDKTRWRVLTIYGTSDMSWVHFANRKNHLTQKVGFVETPKLDPCWKSQPATCKVNFEWKLELNL